MDDFIRIGWLISAILVFVGGMIYTMYGIGKDRKRFTPKSENEEK